MTRTPIRTAVIPAAGVGTRFLPATKAVPKELLPVVDRPMISWAIEEVRRVGADHIVLVTADDKPAIADHLAPDPDLEALLEKTGKLELLERVRAESTGFAVTSVIQPKPLGLGHAVGCARDAAGDEPFIAVLPDEVIIDTLLERMVSVFHERDALAVIGLLEVPPSDISLYGAVDPEDVSAGVVRVRSIIEKPPAGQAPSNLATIGRYIFTPAVFDAIDRITPGALGELQLTDAIQLLTEEGEVYGVTLEHGRWDVGRKVDFLRAGVELALERDDMRAEVEAFVADIARRRGLV